MSPLRLLAGLAGLGLVGWLVWVAAGQIRRRLVPGWEGLEGWLASVIVALSLVTLVSEVLGAVGRFRTWWVAVALVVVAAIVWAVLARREASSSVAPPPPRARTPAHPLPSWLPWFVAVAIAVVAAEWLNALPIVLRHGIVDFDSLWYHLPIAAKLAQTGHFLPIHFYDADAVVSTYPAGSELFHALGMITVGSDQLSPFLNFGWFALCLVAAHVFGRQYGVAHLTTLAALTVLAMPVMIELQGTTALSETMALACLLCAMAFLVIGRGPPSYGQLFLAGLAMGLAASTKFVLLGPAAVLIVGAIGISRRRRPADLARCGAAVSAGALLTGSFWYVRNLVEFGSPVPSLQIGVGSLALPRLHIHGTLGNMVPTLTSPQLQRQYVLPELSRALGMGWSMLISLVVVAGVFACIRRVAPPLRWLGGCAVATFGLGLLTPQYLVHGTFASLWSNFRYLTPGVTISLVVATTALATLRAWAWKFVVVMYLLTATTYWFRPILDTTNDLYFINRPWRLTLVALVAAAAVGALAIHRSTPLGPRTRRATSAGCAALVVVALVVTRSTAVAHRYDFDRGPVPATLYAWAQDQRGRRIAIEPFDFAELVRIDHSAAENGKRMLLFPYPLYGPDGANEVETIATIRGHRAVLPASCHEWWQALARRRITDVVVWLPPGAPVNATPVGAWTTEAPSTRLVLRSEMAGGRQGSLALLSVDPTQPPPC